MQRKEASFQNGSLFFKSLMTVVLVLLNLAIVVIGNDSQNKNICSTPTF